MVEQNESFRLIERARQGDRDAFDELVSPLSARLLRNIGERMGSEVRKKLEPEDVFQETVLRSFSAIKDFRWRGEDSFRSWLEGIATHVILHSARQQARRRESRITLEPPSSEISPSREARRNERFDRLSESVERLPPDYRQVVRLSRLEGLKIDEIAERMQRSPDAVRGLLFRAMRELRRTFDDTESLGLPDRQLGEEGGHDG